jgi:hypothetical protein
MRLRALFSLPLLIAAPLSAQHSPVDCVGISDSNLPPALAAWAGPGAPLTAADGSGDSQPQLEPDKVALVRLRRQGQVRFAYQPGQARTPDDPHAGIVAVVIPAAGRWRVAASAPVWIDVVAPSGVVASVAHGRMAPCTSIRKVVEYELKPGRHLIQLSGNPGPELKLMVSRAP